MLQPETTENFRIFPNSGLSGGTCCDLDVESVTRYYNIEQLAMQKIEKKRNKNEKN